MKTIKLQSGEYCKTKHFAAAKLGMRSKVSGRSAMLSLFKIGGGRGSGRTLVKIETQDSLLPQS